jgi:hypothetical protein
MAAPYLSAIFSAREMQPGAKPTPARVYREQKLEKLFFMEI